MDDGLNALRTIRARSPKAQSLPLAWVMTDPRFSDIGAHIHTLPRDYGLIIRDYGHKDRRAYAQHLSQAAHQSGLKTLIAADPELAQTCHAHGVHWPSWAQPQPIRNQLNIFAVHNLQELKRAEAHNADAVIISPIFPTKSHPSVKTLGYRGLEALMAETQMPIYAMGGVGPSNIDDLLSLGIYGIAGISFLKDRLKM